MPTDSGTVLSDGGNEQPDSGSALPDGGIGQADGGNGQPDSGQPDGGAGQPDGGGGKGDGGNAQPDGGHLQLDGGNVQPDAGACVWALRNPPVTMPALNHHMMGYDSFNHVTVMFGGFTGTSPSAAVGTFRKEVYHWNGTSWLQKADFSRTIARSAFAYDSDRHVFVSNGGNRDPAEAFTAPPVGDTWEYDASTDTWTQKSIGLGPPQRSLHAMAYDSVRKRMVLVAEGDKTMPPILWEYDGATSSWTEKSPPPFASRNRHAMVFDGTRVLLYGGKLQHNLVGPDLSDTWSYDGTTWTEIAGAGGIERSRHVMVWDRTLHKAIVGYGTSTNVAANDVSIFNGASWLPTVHTPPGRNYSAMAYQDHLGNSVMFGGIGLADTWTLTCAP